MGPPQGDGHEGPGSSDRRVQLPPPPPASWPVAGGGKQLGGAASAIAAHVPSWSGFDEDFEVHLPGREHTTFFVRVAGRELAATNGIAVVLHGGGFTGMSWAPAAGVMKRHCCVVAPDLRGHGLTSSAGTDAPRESDASYADDGDECGGEGGADTPLMSLDSLAEDVTSLLVEIFSCGMLLQPQLPQRQKQPKKEKQQQQQQQQQEQQQQQPQQQQQQTPLQTISPPPHPPPVAKSPASSSSCSSSSSSGSGGGPTPPPRGSKDHESGVVTTTTTTTGSATEPQRASPETPSNDVTAEEAHSGSGSGSSSTSSPTIRLLLVGHSLGGSIAVRVAGEAEELRRRCGGAAEIAGVVAVDVVEGTALSALDDMPEILRKIPRSFPSMEDAVRWHVKTGAVRNSASAHAVVPSRLKNDPARDGRVVWRTDLRATERHWRDWFEGMSKAFLELPVPKLLIVAGMDRLDTELTAAHMQGRYQLKLVYGSGHSIQEDQPEETAKSIINFALRNSVFRRGTSGATHGGKPPAGEEEELLRLKLARAREQANRTRR
ncbi:unnamed protein product [Ectocarpus sp. 6 AP-2014]